MRLEQLQAFLAVADTGSFQGAARKCGVTQSTISRQIQALETELGVELLHRTAQAKPTVGGDCLLPRARRIVQEWQQATQALGDLLSGKQPELCVAVIHSACALFLPPILQQFCRDYNQVQLRVTALGSDRALKVLKDGLVDIAIVMHNPRLQPRAEMHIEVLYEEPIQVLMAADHPLTAQTQVDWVALSRYPQVVFKDGYGMQRIVQDQFRDCGLDFQVALELNALEAFRGVVRQGQMVALLPQSALQDTDLDPTLAIRPTTTPQLQRQVVLVTTQDRLKLPPIQHFCQLVRGACKQPTAALGQTLLALS